MYWTYTALNRQGEEVTATLNVPKQDILQLISQRQWHLLEIRPDYWKFIISLHGRKKLSALSSAVFFEDFHNMLETGMSVSQIILIFKETSKNENLVIKLSNVEEQLRHGKSLTESLIEANLFPWIVHITLSSGEKTGRLSEAMRSLGQYFRRSYQVSTKVKQALIYPAIVFTLLLAVMFFVSFNVIPQLKNLLPNESLHHGTTQGVLFFSFFLQQYAWMLGGVIIVVIFGIYSWSRNNCYQFQEWLYSWPIIGSIFKESSLALYLLNLSVLLRSGVALLNAIRDLNVFDPTPISTHFMKSREYMLGGASFWQSIEKNNFFPRIVASTFRRAEEMVKVDEYAANLAEYFSKRTNMVVDGLIHVVQPALLALGGLFLVIIAFAFLLPIYGSLTTIAGGN